MKLPNGYGGVSKLSGKRRKPWRARKTDGWSVDPDTGKAKQRYITIGYYTTRSEALEALSNYNQNPYDIKTESITFAEVYEKWSDIHFETIVPSAARTWKSAYNHSKPLHNMRFKDIRANHLENTIHDAAVGASTKQRMKSLYNLMYRYALKADIVDKNYAGLVDSVKRDKPTIERVPFSIEDIQLLIDNIDFPFVDMLLVGIYTGWRPQELAVLKSANINTVNNTMTGGLKTEAGKNRIIPIHPAIADIVSWRMAQSKTIGSDYLFNDITTNPTHLTYDKYRRRFEKVMRHLKMTHRPHDTRHTFITMAKSNNMDEYILKLIAGHAIVDITEKTYTHRTIEDLHKEIIKIPDYIH